MLTNQEVEAINAIDSKHKETTKYETVLKRQLRDIHQEQLMEPLASAIALEGDAIGQLVLLARGQQPSVLDPADIEDQAETTREVWQEWSRGR